MKSIFTTLLLSFLFTGSLWSNYNVLVTGTMGLANLGKEIDLTVNEKYLNGELIVYTSDISPGGNFAFRLTVNEPELISLNYGGKRALFFLQPNDSIHIDANGTDFPRNIKYSGKGGAENEYLKDYFEKYPVETNQFKLKQYKSGNFWYSNSPEMDHLMMSQEPSTFKATMDMKKESALSELDFFQVNNPGVLSPEFIEFLNTEIIFDRAYHMLLYGNVFKLKYGIQDEFFEFLDEVPLNVETIGNYWSREFLKAYLDYKHQQAGGGGDSNVEKYNIATEYLGGRGKCYAQSYCIARGFKSNDPTTMIGKYWDFIDSNLYPEFSEKLSSIYQKAMKFASGSPAPEFTLSNTVDQLVSLDDFKGKVVYLNFWASWCRPCVKKMESIKSMQAGLEGKEIAFINISLDKVKDTWKNAIQSRGLDYGIHLYANSEISEGVAAEYGVKILPQYFIIDKDGTFARRPKGHDLIAIQNLLLELNGQN